MASDPAMTLGASRKRKRPPSDVLVVPGVDDLRLSGFGGPHSRLSYGAVDEGANYPFQDFASIYAKMRAPDTGLKVMDRRWRLLTYPKCFVGSEAVAWMVETLKVNTDEALEMGQKLIEAGIMHHVTHSEPFADAYYFYRFQEDTDTNVLNMKRVWDASRPPRNALEIAEELLTKLACLCEEYRNCNLTPKDSSGDTGRGICTPTQSPNLGASARRSSSSECITSSPDGVNYERLSKSEKFREYCLAAAELQNVHLGGLSHEKRLVLFVNLYNVLCLHAHVLHGAPTNMWRRWVFFRMLAYRVAGLDMTLDDIEHGILRGNKRPPMFKFMQQLRASDHKCQHVLTQRDGRIHFVISAGTRSDPPVRIMDANSCEEQLHEATEEFLEKSVKVDISKRIVTLPRIFLWYADDFCTPEKKLFKWVASYLNDERAAQLQALSSEDAEVPTIVYENFDWGTSDAQFNAAVVRRKRRRLERQRSAGSNVMSPNILGFNTSTSLLMSPSFGAGNVGSQPVSPAMNGTGLGNSSPLLLGFGRGGNPAGRSGGNAGTIPCSPKGATYKLEGSMPIDSYNAGDYPERQRDGEGEARALSRPLSALDVDSHARGASTINSEMQQREASEDGSVTQLTHSVVSTRFESSPDEDRG
eukprot:Plantae.Rhodophyta-Hildenbrandia_rubra.ctg14331.p1 GENE.Plantae.Rhodophyta-Hildenbrandia_rubra.ctg14331~~Plantae.Rhodophyta-Hildenbrandia_rubra.ctg14331.p1  ORF type:complete len:643 (-),score=76.15 Plantae.Rhodophyta-Hildenbrandia_rubra.ctg14331:518-2446(-)